MSLYHVKTGRSMNQIVECDVEANSQDEAEEKALKLFETEDCDFTNDFSCTPEVSCDFETTKIN